jgi:hypothetical protein
MSAYRHQNAGQAHDIKNANRYFENVSHFKYSETIVRHKNLISFIYWGIVSCNLLEINRRFERKRRMHLRGRRSQARSKLEGGSKPRSFVTGDVAVQHEETWDQQLRPSRRTNSSGSTGLQREQSNMENVRLADSVEGRTTSTSSSK